MSSSRAVRLQVLVARAGIASRRAAEAWVTAGRVRVNGRVIRELGRRADPDGDVVEVDGHGRVAGEARVWVALHKPAGVLSTVSDPAGRPTVCELLGASRAVGSRRHEGGMPRVWPVGRLDWDAEGLILISNDGPLAARLLHPRAHVPKRYLVKVRGRPSPAALARLAGGVRLPAELGRPPRTTLPAEVEVAHVSPRNTWLSLTLRQGINHQVKRMCQAVGHPCLRLVRDRFAGVELGSLAPGAWRHLGDQEVLDLGRPAARRLAKAPASALSCAASMGLAEGG